MTTEWRIAKTSSRRRRRQDGRSERGLSRQTSLNTEDVWRPEEIEHSLSGLRKSVGESEMLRQNLMRLKELPLDASDSLRGLVIYGLGSLSRRQSRYQLAFLLEILSEFPRIHIRQVCDPVFTSVDVSVLNSLGIEVLSDNDDARLPLSVPSFVFMPHLERVYLENFFAAHVENGFLCQSLILCDSLSKILEQEKTSPNTSQQALSHLLTAGKLGSVHETALVEADLENTTAFNDLSFHCVFPHPHL